MSQSVKNYSSIYLHNSNAGEAGINDDGQFGYGVMGKYTAAGVTLADLDMAFLRLTSDGRLMVDTELTLDGNVMIDNVAVWATNIADSSTASFALVDTDGHPQVDVLTLPGGLTGYAEDAAHTTGDIGLMSLVVRHDAVDSLCDTDLDYTALQVNSKGALYTDLSAVLGSTMGPTNGAFFNLTDNTTVAEIVASIKSLKTDTSSVAGTATNVNGGNRDAGTQTITLADNDPAVVSLAIIDDWDESDRCKVNPIVGQAGVSANSGVLDATTQRITIATDDTVATDLTAIKTATEIIDDWDAVHDSAVSTDGPQVMMEAKTFDGLALPNDVAEGDAVRPAATEWGVQYVYPVNKDGSTIAEVNLEKPINIAGTAGFLITVLNARGSTGRDNNTGISVSEFKWVSVEVVSASSADLTVQCEGSIDDNNDFSTNVNSFIKMKDYEDGGVIDGDTGIVFTGTDDTILYNVECEGLSWLNFNVTAWTAGTVTIKIRGFNN